eukprot:g71849.t1
MSHRISPLQSPYIVATTSQARDQAEAGQPEPASLPLFTVFSIHQYHLSKLDVAKVGNRRRLSGSCNRLSERHES